MPFFGDVRRASIYVLLLNPGLGPHDYYAEYEVPAFRAAVLANLRQDFNGTTERFLFLDPRFAWHGGFAWWHGKLAGVIERLADKWKVAFAEARKRLAAQLACIELLPYQAPTPRTAAARGRFCFLVIMSPGWSAGSANCVELVDVPDEPNAPSKMGRLTNPVPTRARR